MTFAADSLTSQKLLAHREQLIDPVPAVYGDPVIWIAADTVTGLSNNDELEAVYSPVGDNSQFGTVGTPTYVTNAQNGLPAFDFVPVEALTGTQVFTLKPATLFVVAVWDSLSSTRTLVGNVSGNSALQFRTNGTSLNLVEEGTALIGSNSTALSTATWYVVDASYSSSGAFLFGLDGVNDGSGTNDRTIQPAALCIGGRDNAAEERFDGRIGEVAVFDYVLGTEHRQRIRDYLVDKWGV